jgi:hypothetical protein
MGETENRKSGVDPSEMMNPACASTGCMANPSHGSLGWFTSVRIGPFEIYTWVAIAS